MVKSVNGQRVRIVKECESSERVWEWTKSVRMVKDCENSERV